ncbi:hypothetical protein CHUAL_002060 [Chamberlinius hualienensis]
MDMTSRPCVKHVLIPALTVEDVTVDSVPKPVGGTGKCFTNRSYPSTANATVKQDFNWNYKPTLNGRRRRLSTGTASVTGGLACNDLASTKRRLSQVGEVVSRRFSAATIGWKNLGQIGNNKAIVDEARGLCAQYIRARLRRSSIFHRKCLSLQRLRSVMNMTATTYGGSTDTFHYLNILGKELELRHPKTFGSVCRQICRTITSETILQDVFLTVASRLVPKDEPITWNRVVALFAITGGLACDCVQQGHVDYVMSLIEYFGIFVENQLTYWISQQGGWVIFFPF